MKITLNLNKENQRNNTNKISNPFSVRDNNLQVREELIQLNKMILEIINSQN